MSARLVPLTPGAAPAVSIQRPVLLIGRHPECDIRIDLPKISRRHCCVALAYERIMIRDLGSRNGVRVNGRLIDEVQLHPGDEIAIGPILYRVENPQPAPSLPAARPRAAKAKKPPSLPSLPSPRNDPEDLIPIDL